MFRIKAHLEEFLNVSESVIMLKQDKV